MIATAEENRAGRRLMRPEASEDPTLAFYEALAGDYHLIFGDWPASVRWQGDTLDRLIRANLGEPPRSVLDCSCGIGTQAIGLAQRGYRVHATDLSPAAVDRAAREARAAGVSLTVGVADLRTLATDVAGRFDVVLSCDNALPHLLTAADLRWAVRGMAAKLEPGGLWLASIRDYEQALRDRPRAEMPRVFDDPAGRRIVFQVWDWWPDEPIYDLHLFVLRAVDGAWATAHYTARYRALARAELDAALRDAGLTAVTWHLPPDSGYYQPVVTARAGSGTILPPS
jgi:SAM-dependent methyltransferase